MAKNTLFNFLFTNEATVQLPQGHKLVLDSNKESHKYYRIECHKPVHVIVKDKENLYTLDKHHISVYQHEYRDNPKLSQYHYTAEFTNQLGGHYRLHVYFNAFDNLLPNITFEEKTNNGYELVDSKDLKSQFIHLALKHTDPLIKKLRQQHNEAIRVLETRYNECDERLAQHFDSQKEDTIGALQITKEACDILRKLIPLVRSSNYPKFLRFHEMAARSLRERHSIQVAADATSQIENLNNTSINVHENISSHVEVTSQNVASSKEEVPPADITCSQAEEAATANITFSQVEEAAAADVAALPKIKTNSSKKSNTQAAHELELELKKLSSQFAKLTEAPKEVQAKKIERLLAKTYGISLLYERQINVRDLQQIQKIRRGLHALGANLLPNLLFNKQFELASLLTSFHPLLRDEKYLRVALQTRNSKLLDFILEYGDIDVNNLPVTVRKTSYPSAVHACFYEDSSSNSMTECFSVLIKHGGSLFAPDNKNKDLPLAYSILSSDTHPLFKALQMNRDKTINSIDFLKNLIVLLRAYLERNDLSMSELNSIELELKRFEIELEALQNPQLSDSSLRYLTKRANSLEEKYFGSLINKLKRDPNIIAINKELQIATSKLASKLTKAQRRQGCIAATNNLENLDKLLEGIDMTDMDFDFIKTEVLKNLNNNLQLIEKKSQLIDVQKEITRYQIYSRRGGRKYRELLREQDTLLQEIKRLESENSLNLNNEDLENTLEALEFITETLESLNGMSSLLTRFSSLFASIAQATPALPADEAEEADFALLDLDGNNPKKAALG
ncbi:hypothetical protein [Legionella bozemanae]|uniref:hypothetical protein n=1 Tax=Legionella bozemanae TaxID=447 RepID=UPI00399C6020